VTLLFPKRARGCKAAADIPGAPSYNVRARNDSNTEFNGTDHCHAYVSFVIQALSGGKAQ